VLTAKAALRAVAGQEPAQRAEGTVGTAVGGMTVVPPGTFGALGGESDHWLGRFKKSYSDQLTGL
jgi:hypothetical protein